MSKSAGFKRTQVQGKKYDLPKEEIDIEKLIQKGLGLAGKISVLKAQLDAVHLQLIDIAKKRREGSTTVKLQGVSGQTIVTFREKYECKDKIEEIKHELGALFDRFFKKTIEFKAQKELGDFLDGKNDYGFDDPAPVKNLILANVDKKSTKPNVKIEAL